MRAIFKHKCLFTAVLALAGLLCVQVQAEEQPKDETQQAVPSADLRGYHQFEYTFQDRPDPFLPFLGLAGPDTEPPEEVEIDPNQILTGLQKFEPGQLKLVAVLGFKDENIAMLEDVTGKGYVVKQGMAIGRHGTVTSIEPDVLLVTERYETTTGRKIVNKISMRMQQQ